MIENKMLYIQYCYIILLSNNHDNIKYQVFMNFPYEYTTNLIFMFTVNILTYLLVC